MTPTMTASVGGSIGNGRIMARQHRPYYVRSIALAMWLQAKATQSPARSPRAMAGASFSSSPTEPTRRCPSTSRPRTRSTGC